MFKIDHKVVKSDRLSLFLPPDNILRQNLVLVKDDRQVFRPQSRGTVGIRDHRFHGQLREAEIIGHMEDVPGEIRVETGEGSTHVIPFSTSFFNKSLKFRDDPVIASTAGIILAETVIDFFSSVKAQDHIVALPVGPLNDFIRDTDPVGGQCETEILLFFLLDRARISDEFLADLKIHEGFAAKEVDLQIPAQARIFHEEIQGTFSCLKGHQSVLTLEIPLCGKAVTAVEVAGMRHQKAQGFDDGTAFFEVKCLVFKSLSGKKLSRRAQFLNVVQTVPDILSRHPAPGKAL